MIETQKDAYQNYKDYENYKERLANARKQCDYLGYYLSSWKDGETRDEWEMREVRRIHSEIEEYERVVARCKKRILEEENDSHDC